MTAEELLDQFAETVIPLADAMMHEAELRDIRPAITCMAAAATIAALAQADGRTRDEAQEMFAAVWNIMAEIVGDETR